MNQLLKQCPVCGNKLLVTELECKDCETKITGKFSNCKFCQLDVELQEFIEIFVISEGNFKQVEKVLNCSYPKVKNYLRKIAKSFGYKGTIKRIEKEEAINEEKILDLLDKGEINFEEAMKRLKK